MIYYFAYGSNMNEQRMLDRGITSIVNKELAFLDDYEFTINKKSSKLPGIGFANVKPLSFSHVEGILYKLSNDDEIKLLDKFEGYPKHYVRKTLSVKLINETKKDAIVYIATKEWTVSEELETTEEYKNHILEGDNYLTENYIDLLRTIIKVKNNKNV